MSASHADLVRQCYEAYTNKDRDLIESLLADDFTFSSPLDDHISRAKYFERCWPNSAHHEEMVIEKLVEQGEDVYVTYHCKRTNGVEFRNTEHFKVRNGKIAEVEVFFGREEGTSSDEAQVRSIVEGTEAACEAGDVQALVEHYAADMEAYDVVNPLRYQSAAEVAKRAQEWLNSFEGPIQYEQRDVKVVAGQEVAFCYLLNHVQGTKKNDGQSISMWWRQTLGFRKVEDAWQVVHSHSSVPFDMETGMASLGLEP